MNQILLNYNFYKEDFDVNELDMFIFDNNYTLSFNNDVDLY